MYGLNSSLRYGGPRRFNTLKTVKKKNLKVNTGGHRQPMNSSKHRGNVFIFAGGCKQKGS